MFRRLLSLSLLVPLATACGDVIEPTQVVDDAGPTADSSTKDASTTTGTLDASAHDASIPDASVPDTATCSKDLFLQWTTPGCGASEPKPQCLPPPPPCIEYACSCAGKVISGCETFLEPYSFIISGSGSSLTLGGPCPAPQEDAG
jgi:hypothetical protein